MRPKSVLTKFISVALCLAMLLSCCPVHAFATESGSLEVNSDLPEESIVKVVEKSGGEPEGEKSGGELEGKKSGGEPEGEKSGGEPEDEKSGGEPEGEKSGGELEGEKSGGEPEGEKSGGEPEGEKSGGEPEGEKSGGEPEDEKSGGEPEDEKLEEGTEGEIAIVSGEGTEGEGSEEGTEGEDSEEGTEGESSEEGIEGEESEEGTEGEGSEEGIEGEGSEEGIEGEGSEEGTEGEGSEEGTEGEGSEEGTEGEGSEEGTEGEGSEEGTEGENLEEIELIGEEDPNDGKFAVVCTIESGNQTVEYYAAGETVTLSVPTKEHYVFTGWKVVCDLPITIGNNKFVMPEARVDVAAQWEPETYSIAIYYFTLEGKTLRSAKFSEVTYGYEFALDGGYSLPSVDGYTLSKITREGAGSSWTDFDNFRNFMNIPSVEKDEVFCVWYEPAEVTYNVYHYKQKLDGTYPEEASESEVFNGKFGDNVSLSSYVKSYTGFTWDGNTDEITLSTSGNVIRIYYTRNSYRLYYEKTEDDTDSMQYPYETQIAISTLGTPTRVGYIFAGWQTSNGEEVTGDTFTMPAHDVTFVAKWTPDVVTYTVYYWGETKASAQEWTDRYHATDSSNRTPTAYGYVGKTAATGTVGSIVSQENAQTAASGIIDSAIYTYETMDENVTVAADGTTVVNVYYRRNVYWYGFIKNGSAYSWNGHTGYIYHKYGANVVAYWPTFDENNGKIVWIRTSNGNIVQAASSAQEGQNVELKFSNISSATFTLWAYKENATGGYDGATRYEYVTFSGFSHLDIAMIDSRLPEGFEYDSYYSVSNGWKPFPANKHLYDSATTGSTEITLKRKLYTVTFNDGNLDVSTSGSIRFEASIADVSVPEITAPIAFEGYEFIGFVAAHNGVLYRGSTPQEAYNAFKTAVNDKMLATNVTLTASWQAPIYTVNFYDDSTMSELIGSQTVERGKTVTNHPEIPTRVNHTFNGWFYMDGEIEKLYWEGKTILSDMNVYAKWIADELIYADILVKHNYLSVDGTVVESTEEETIQAVVGSIATIDAKEIEGYFPDFIFQNIEVLESGNVVVFNYMPLGEVEYTVRYIDAEGNELLPDVKKTSDKMIVTETYRYIARCTPRTISQILKLSANPENNIITFVYDVEGTSIYVVNHYLQEIDGTYTLYETEADLEVRNYTQVYATERTYEGYEFNAEISNTDDWVVPNKSVVLNLYYDRMEYTVEYRYKEGYVVPEGASELPETVTYKFGAEVTVADILEAPIGYKFVGWLYAEDGSEAIGTFEMPKANVIIEGYYEQLDYYIVVEWTHEDGNYHGGTYTWDCEKLEYVHDTSASGWSKVPYVKATVKNYGSKAVNLEFVAEADLWSSFFAEGGNPFSNLSIVTLEGNGAEYSFEFSTDNELKWNYDLLNEEAMNVAVNDSGSSQHTNHFKLNITEA